MSNSYDVIVVGGGIIGCAIGWRLAQAGRKVAVLERGRVGGEASSAAGGIFCPRIDPETPEFQFRFWYKSHQMYPAFVEEVRETTGHAFEFRAAGTLSTAFTDQEVAALEAIYPLQAPGGIRAQWMSATEVREEEPELAPNVQAGILYPDHVLVDNARLTAALGWAVRRSGGDLFENCIVTGLVIEGARITGVDTATGRLNAPIVVNCAGSWSGSLDARVPKPIRPIKGQMLAVDSSKCPVRHITQCPGGGVVPRADGRILIGSTIEDIGYDKDVIAGDIMNLLEGAARMLPGLRKARLLETWAGLRPVTPDRQPLMGPDPEIAGLYWSTGHWTMGILMTPATAQVMSELILTGKATIPEEYAVDRFMKAGVGVQ